MCANPNPTCWINPAAFAATVPFGQFGNVGRSSVPGPSNFQTDLAITRLFKVREHMGFEIRGEAFNLPNHLNPIRRDLAVKAGFPEKSFGEDHEFSRRVHPLLKTQADLPVSIYNYLYRTRK